MEDNTSSCANCGKGEENSITLKKCGACKMVKYCSSACQKAHRTQHKKECKKRAAELHEEALFKQPPPPEDCPICMLPLSTAFRSKQFMHCCGKVICIGCVVAVKKRASICPFCRTVAPSGQEDVVERTKKRIEEANDSTAMFNLGCYHFHGMNGVSKDVDKALELWHRASDLGCSEAQYSVAYSQICEIGNKESQDPQKLHKAIHYYELAAMAGNALARDSLGQYEEVYNGNKRRALKHYMIAANTGLKDSLDNIKKLYLSGHATKDDYATALRAYQSHANEIRSEQRDEGAASIEDCK